MKRILFLLLTLILLSGCNQPEQQDETDSMTDEPIITIPTEESTHEATTFLEPTVAPTITATATPDIPQAESEVPTPVPNVLPVEPVSNWSVDLPDSAVLRRGMGELNTTSVSPNGSYLAVVSTLGIGVFIADTLEEVWFVRSPGALGSAEWSPDGTLLAVTTEFPHHELLGVLEARTGSLKGEYHTVGDYGIDAVAWSPQSDRLAVASYGGVLVLGRDANVVQEMILPDAEGRYAGGTLSVTWSPDGSMLAAGLEYSSPDVRVWNMPSGEVVGDWTTDSHESLSVLAFSPDGTQLAAVGGWGRWSDDISGDKRIFLWNIATDESVVLDGQDIHYRIGLEWHSDGRHLAVYGTSGIGEGAGEISVWDLETQTEHELLGHSQTISDIEWSPDETKLAVGGGNYYQRTGEVSVWDVETEERILSFEPLEEVEGIHWLTDKQLLAHTWKGIEVRDLTSGEIVNELQGSHYLFHNRWIDNQLVDQGYQPDLALQAISPQGSMIASLQETGWLSVFEPATNQVVYEWQVAEYLGMPSLIWSPDQSQLVITNVYYDGDTLWDVASQHRLIELPSVGRYAAAAFSPDSGRVVLEDVVYDTHTGEPIIQLNGIRLGVAGMPEDMHAAAWSPDGSKLALGSGENGRNAPSNSMSIVVWDTATWQVLYTISAETVMTSSLAWSPDGQYLAAGGGLPYAYEMFTPHRLDDNQIMVFDAATGALVRTFAGHRDRVGSLSWSPDSTMLASGSEDGVIFVWSLLP